MTDEYFEYMEELQDKKAEARRQREKMYSQLQAENNSLKNDNAELCAKIRDWKNRHEEIESQLVRLKKENTNLKTTVTQLQNELEKALAQLAEIEAYKQSCFPYVLVEHKYEETEEDRKKEKKLEDKIKELQEKLGKESVPLSVLAEGLKDYAEEAGIGEAHNLFNHLNNLLSSVPAWTENVPQLKQFFRQYNKKLIERNITMTGKFVTYNENNK